MILAATILERVSAAGGVGAASAVGAGNADTTGGAIAGALGADAGVVRGARGARAGLAGSAVPGGAIIAPSGAISAARNAHATQSRGSRIGITLAAHAARSSEMISEAKSSQTRVLPLLQRTTMGGRVE